MSLEEYFKQSVSLPDAGTDGQGLSQSEQAFLEKYMGQNWREALQQGGLAKPAKIESLGLEGLGAAEAKPAQPQAEALSEEAYLEELASREQLQLVSFMIEDQEFAVPIEMIQEVIRRIEPTKLPTAPAYIMGIVNLRGRVTPIVEPRVLLELGSDVADEGRFIIVCRYAGLGLGLMVKAIATMHRARGRDIEWGIEARVGVGAQMLAGLLKLNDRLIKIVSVQKLFEQVMRR